LTPFVLRLEGPDAEALTARLMKTAARSRLPARAWASREGRVFRCGVSEGGPFVFRSAARTLHRGENRWLLPEEASDSGPEFSAGALARLAGLPVFGPDSDGAFSAGGEYAGANWPASATPPEPENEPVVALNGETAIAAACLWAGCGFFAVSGSAPVSGARRALKRLDPERRVRLHEAGDAVAAAFSAAGAGYGGLRAAAEVPYERDSLAAPAAAWAASSETAMVLLVSESVAPESYGGIVRVPASVREVFRQVAAAFDLAESYQTSVTIVIEPALRFRWETVPEPAAPADLHRGRWCRPGPGGPFDRYSDPEDGISPRSAPGMPGLEHSAGAVEGDDEPRRKERIRKLSLKEASLKKAFGPGPLRGRTNGAVVVAAGGPAALLRDAASDGTLDCGLLAIRTLRPFSAEAVAEKLRGRRVLVAVERHDDPLLRLVRSDAGISGAESWRVSAGDDPESVLASLREALRDG